MKYILILLGLMGITQAQTLGRSVIGSAGGDGGGLTFTVGETVIETATGNNVSLTQGFQQPDTVFLVGNDPLLGVFDLKLYPNPTKEQLFLEASLQQATPLVLVVVDARGRAVLPKHHLPAQVAFQTSLDVRTLAEGSYFLQIQHLDGTLLEMLKFQRN